MAEAWLREIAGDRFEVESAGLEPGTIKPVVIDALREVNIDLSQKATQTVSDVHQSGRLFHYVIALCDRDKAERCPTFPGNSERLHWDIPERPKSPQTKEQQMAHVKAVRDLIKSRVETWVAENP